MMWGARGPPATKGRASTTVAIRTKVASALPATSLLDRVFPGIRGTTAAAATTTAAAAGCGSAGRTSGDRCATNASATVLNAATLTLDAFRQVGRERPVLDALGAERHRNRRVAGMAVIRQQLAAIERRE